MSHVLASALKISADKDILKRQVQEYEVSDFKIYQNRYVQSEHALTLKTLQPTYKEVLDKEHEVHILLNKGSEMVSKLGRSNEAQNLRAKLDNYKKQWEKIRKDATDRFVFECFSVTAVSFQNGRVLNSFFFFNRHTRLQGCYESCKKFHHSAENFIPWLEQAETKLNSMQPISLKKKELDKQMKELQVRIEKNNYRQN